MDALRRVVHVEKPVRGNRLGLPLQLERLDLLDRDSVVYQPERLLAEQDFARLRGLLEAGGHVDRIPGREPLLRSGYDLARVHSYPSLQPELGKRVAHLDGRAARPQRVVLVHLRDAEDGHHCVADELLHRSAVRLDDRPSSARSSGRGGLGAPRGRSTLPMRSSRSCRRREQ